MKADPVATTPYVGPVPFSSSPADRERFYGRSREAEEIISFIYSQPVVCLFAPSGTGKSSLMNAAVLPALKEKGFDVLPPARVRSAGQSDAPDDGITCRYMYEALQSLAITDDERPGPTTTLAEFLRARGRDHLDAHAIRLLLLDQFEEVLTIYSSTSYEEQLAFFSQVGEALDDDPLLRVAMVVREDHLLQIEPLARHLPDGLGRRFQLERLDRKAALEAIIRPAERTERTYEPDAAELLVDRLRQAKAETRPGHFDSIPHRFVEPVQLQIVCDALWSGTDAPRITKERVEEFGEVNEVLAKHYDKVVGDVAAECKVKEARIRAWIGESLITPMGTRGTAFRGDDTDGMRNDVVDALENRHLVRAERRAAGRWYELVHDSFVDSIRASNRSWFATRSRRRARRWIALIATMAVLAATMVGVNTVRNRQPDDAVLRLESNLLVTLAHNRPTIRFQLLEDAPVFVAAFAYTGPSDEGTIQIQHDGEPFDVADLDPGPDFAGYLGRAASGAYELSWSAPLTGDEEVDVSIRQLEGRLAPDDSVSGTLAPGGAAFFGLPPSTPSLIEVRSPDFAPEPIVYLPTSPELEQLPLSPRHDQAAVFVAPTQLRNELFPILVVDDTRLETENLSRAAYEVLTSSSSGRLTLPRSATEPTLLVDPTPGHTSVLYEIAPAVLSVLVTAASGAVDVEIIREGGSFDSATADATQSATVLTAGADYIIVTTEGTATLRASAELPPD